MLGRVAGLVSSVEELTNNQTAARFACCDSDGI